MASPAEVVSDVISSARDYAESAISQMESATAALTAAITAEPTLEVNWESVGSPSAPSAPVMPGFNAAEFNFDQDGSIASTKPSAYVASVPEIDIDEFTEAAPTTVFPDAPVVTIGDAPTIPAVAEIAVPVAPTITLPSSPTYLALTTPTFAGLDLHTDFLANLETVPTLSLVAPTPYSYAPGATYASDVLTALKEGIEQRLAGGTGLSAAVETAIWDRARDREAALAQARLDEVQRDGEALGFHIPAGVTTARLREAQREYYDKVSGLSRDVAIKQAELEQANLEKTIQAGIELEGRLIDYSYKLESLAYDSAKYLAENAIQVHNAQVGHFQALVQGYTAYATAYRTLVEGEQLKVEEYKAKIQMEQAKAETNRTLTEQFKAEVEARMTNVRIFESQVQAARTLVEIEGAKIAAAAEQVKAYVAGINGQTARVEAYKAQVQAEGEKVQVYKIKADAFASKVQGQVEEARAQIAYYEGVVRAKTAEWNGWQARVGAEAERIRAVGMKSQSGLDGFRANIELYRAQATQQATYWEASIKQYEAQRNYTLAAAKLNTDITQANRSAILEAGKVAAQAYAQLAGSAYNMINAQAGVSASANNQVSYSYSNDTTDAAPTVTAV